MGNAVFSLSASLDGYMAGPNGELDWHFVDEELHAHFNDWLGKVAAFVEGRVTYELMEDFWPTAAEQPDATPTMREFAGIWRDMPKIVFSTTLETVGQNATIKRSVEPDEIADLKKRGDFALGGPNLAATFIGHDLIDEFRLYVHPIVLGRGQPAFLPHDRSTAITLVDTRTFGNGVVLLHYKRDLPSDHAGASQA